MSNKRSANTVVSFKSHFTQTFTIYSWFPEISEFALFFCLRPRTLMKY